MKFNLRFTCPTGEVEAITSSLAKFERMRSIPGLVVIGALALLALLALPPLAAVAGGFGFVVMAVLTLSWMRTVRKATASALEFTELSSVTASDWGLVVTRETGKLEVAWSDVLYATRTKAGWIFVAKKSNAAVVLPVSVLSDAQVGQLTNMLSGWPMRRNRNAPW